MDLEHIYKDWLHELCEPNAKWKFESVKFEDAI